MLRLAARLARILRREPGLLIVGRYKVARSCRNSANKITLYRWAPYLNKTMGIKEARITIGEVDEKISLTADATNATFRVTLPKGPAMLQTWLTRPDENLGWLRARLDELGLTENTLLIFMTDNGTTA